MYKTVTLAKLRRLVANHGADSVHIKFDEYDGPARLSIRIGTTIYHTQWVDLSVLCGSLLRWRNLRGVSCFANKGRNVGLIGPKNWKLQKGQKKEFHPAYF